MTSKSQSTERLTGGVWGNSNTNNASIVASDDNTKDQETSRGSGDKRMTELLLSLEEVLAGKK